MIRLLVVIYIAFISLGLPDAVLGAVWPEVRLQLGVPLAYAGIASTVVCCGTIVSSLFSTRLVRRFGTKGVTLVSVLLTAVALLGYARAQSFGWVCLVAIPLGLGAGSIDSALNNFVALHYKAKQMSWLHCFWGLGATAGPVILSAFMDGKGGWRGGVLTLSMLQFVLVVLLVGSLPLWKKAEEGVAQQTGGALLSNREVLRIPGVKTAVLSFFCYCAAEVTAGLWASTYLVEQKAFSAATAAGLASLYYAGITAGRFLCGFFTDRFSGKALIRTGTLVCIAGAVLLMLPLPQVCSMAGLLLVGFGCAPIFPCMLHETPARFGTKASQAVIGLQMACAYTGSMLMPPLFGGLAQTFSAAWYPLYLLVFFVLMLLACERTNRLQRLRPA